MCSYNHCIPELSMLSTILGLFTPRMTPVADLLHSCTALTANYSTVVTLLSLYSALLPLILPLTKVPVKVCYMSCVKLWEPIKMPSICITSINDPNKHSSDFSRVTSCFASSGKSSSHLIISNQIATCHIFSNFNFLQCLQHKQPLEWSHLPFDIWAVRR